RLVGVQPSDGVVLTTSGTIGVVRGAVRHPRHFVLAPLTHLVVTERARAACVELIRLTGTAEPRLTGARFAGTELIRLTGVTGADIGSLLAQPLVQRLTLGLLGLGHAVPIGTRPAFRRLCAAFQ